MSALSALVGDDVAVAIGERTFVLRPTLRAAIGMLRMGGEGGYAAVLDELRDGSFNAAMRLVAIGAHPEPEGPDVDAAWAAFADGDLTEALGRFVLTVANGGETPKPIEVGTEQGGRSAMTHEDYLARLFKIGVGWLGWTPDETLDAPMPAIISAYIGRQDMLRALFGGAEPAPSRNDIPLGDKVRLAMAGAKKVERPKRPSMVSEGR